MHNDCSALERACQEGVLMVVHEDTYEEHVNVVRRFYFAPKWSIVTATDIELARLGMPPANCTWCNGAGHKVW